MSDEKNIITRSREYVKENLISICLVLLCIVWLLMGLVTLKLTGKTRDEIIADTIMCILFGLSINRMCVIIGIKKGKQTDKYINTNNLHGEKVTQASKNINALVKWCNEENDINKKEEQTKRLIPLGISYEDFIEDKIDYSRYDKPEKIKKKIKKIKHIKLHQISVDALTTIMHGNTDKFDYGRTEKQYTKIENRGDLISKIMIYIVLGVITIDLFVNFSLANLILRLIQLVMLLSLGAFKYANAYTFIVDEFRAGTIKKINDLDRFLNSQKKEEGNNGFDGRREEETKAVITRTSK